MNVFFLELRNLRKGALAATLSIAGVIFFILAFFPSMQTESMQALANAKLEGVDPALLAALGLAQMPDFTLITHYFGYALQFITLAVMVILTQRGVDLLLKEETSGAISFLGAKPLSRSRIFLEKALAHVALHGGMSLVWAAVTAAGYLLFSDYTLGAAVREAGIFFSALFWVGLVFSAVGILLSALLKAGRPTGGVAMAIVFGSFLLGLLSVTVSGADFLVWLSPMDWIKPAKLLGEGILWQEWAVGFGAIFLAMALAWLRYRKKDWLA